MPPFLKGRILSQLPPPGTQVRRGWQIRVAESLGPQRVEIPNVLGESQRAAEINIRRRGLDVGAVAQIAMRGAPADQVLAKVRHRMPAASPLRRSVCWRPNPRQPQAFLMPNFTGQALGGVTLVLQDTGFRLGSVNIAPSITSPPAAIPDSPAVPSPPSPPPLPNPASVIVSQNPAPGAKIVAGSAVNFEVR